MNRIKNLIFVIAALFMFSACEESNNSIEKGTLSLRLTDAPADYQEVLIDVEEVRVSYSTGEEGEEDWRTLENVNAGTYNLLKFTNGMDTLLAEEELPAGTIAQMRLILGENNRVKTDGKYQNIQTPSAQESGLKFNVHAELTPGINYKLWIDFDAGRSIVKKGNGGYLLKPVIRTYTEATNGAIDGVVEPVESEPYIMAISESDDTIGTYADTTSGEFLIEGLDVGSYDVEFGPVEGYEDHVEENVSVIEGNVTSLDTITLQANNL